MGDDISFLHTHFCCNVLCVPGDFYHATAIYEPSVESDKQDLEHRLEDAIQHNFVAAHGSKRVELKQDVLSVDDITVHLTIPTQPPNETSTEFTFNVRDVSAEAQLAYISYSSPAEAIYRLKVSGKNIAAKNPHMFFPCPSGEVLGRPMFSPREACLVVDSHTSQLIDVYKKSLKGFPSSDSSGHYWRMLYFSAVTITTLGYGDIVPLTARTRAIVTIEIVLGPILFGLFLNSLVREGNRDG